MNLNEQENSNPFRKNPPKFRVPERPPPPQPHSHSTYETSEKKKSD